MPSDLGADQVLRAVPYADHRPERMQVWQAASAVSQMAQMPPMAPPASISVSSGNTTKKVATHAHPTGAIGLNDALKQHKTGTRPFIQADVLYPTWLLTQPLKLTVRNNAPLCAEGGPLTLLAGPQRVEAGWWSVQTRGDASPPAPCALRDYFLARSEQMGLLWIYRERLGRHSGAGRSAQRYSDSRAGQNAEGSEGSEGSDWSDWSDWYLHGLFA